MTFDISYGSRSRLLYSPAPNGSRSTRRRAGRRDSTGSARRTSTAFLSVLSAADSVTGVARFTGIAPLIVRGSTRSSIVGFSAIEFSSVRGTRRMMRTPAAEAVPDGAAGFASTIVGVGLVSTRAGGAATIAGGGCDATDAGEDGDDAVGIAGDEDNGGGRDAVGVGTFVAVPGSGAPVGTCVAATAGCTSA